MFGDVLVVDDEKDICRLIAGVLTDENYEVRTASESDGALREVSNRCPSLVVLDIWLQGSRLDGLEVLNILRERYPALPVVVISGHGNIDMAVSAIRAGAYDYIEKPFKSDKLILTVQRAIETNRLRRENNELRNRFNDNFTLMGQAPIMEQLNQKIDKLAQANSRIMILGATGAGKEVVAHELHRRSSRQNQGFMTVHGTIFENNVTHGSDLLFGTQSDGHIEHGLIEQAQGGTLYLDEISEFPLQIQDRILKMLLDNSFVRNGSEDKVMVTARILSSCSGNVEHHISEGRLRRDLYHRLNVVTLDVPSLKKRRDDIPLLVKYLISNIADQFNMRPCKIDHDVMAILQSHSWPGNMRQLRNCIEHIMLSCQARKSDEINMEHLPSEIVSDTDVNENVVSSGHIMTLPLREARERFEREYLIAQIERFSGNISRTAEFVGMERSALHRKLKSLGIGGGNHARSHA